MSSIYKPNISDKLAKFLKKAADNNTTIVIPDLQRPYVWEPQQVIRLIDSIFKRWPFGSLLCWKVENEPEEIIPHRPFWNVVARGFEDRASRQKEAFFKRGADSYTMILDGQQRIQSLLLALGNESCGFTLSDKLWKKNIDGLDTDIDSKHWSAGCLCLNAEKFMKEYIRCENDVRNVNLEECLEWVITDLNDGFYPKNKAVHVLPLKDPKKHIRFSEIWDIATPDITFPEGYETELRSRFPSLLSDAYATLARFMITVLDVKQHTDLTRLDIEPFDESGISDRSNYNDAIVNIFARLNQAGRALSDQEITSAWLKTGWREADVNKNADCQEALQKLLAKFEEGNTINVNMDALIDILTLFWTIAGRTVDKRDDLLLKNSELLNGKIMKSIGRFSFENWNTIEEAIDAAKEEYDAQNLNECFPNSLYAFYVTCGWQFICQIARKNIEGTGTKRETEHPFTVQTNAAFMQFLDRWFFSSSLAQKWSRKAAESYKDYILELRQLYAAVKDEHDADKTIVLLKGKLDTILASLKDDACDRIKNIKADNRKEVIKYKDLLWLWNRLTQERYDEIKKPLLPGRSRVYKNEVDHAISVDQWLGFIKNSYPPEKRVRNERGEEIDILLDNRAFSTKSLEAFINAMGNCSLLLRGHNRSKSNDEYGLFLQDVYAEEENRKKIIAALCLNDVFLYPSKQNIALIIKNIEEREALIKKELVEYISNITQSRSGKGA